MIWDMKWEENLKGAANYAKEAWKKKKFKICSEQIKNVNFV